MLDIKAEIRKIVHSECEKPIDRLAECYLLANQLLTYSNQERDGLKASIMGWNSVPEQLSKIGELVAESGVMHVVTLLQGKYYDIGAQVKRGGAFVDLEVLKSELGVSDKRWDAAIKEATSQRPPTVTLSVARRAIRRSLG